MFSCENDHSNTIEYFATDQNREQIAGKLEKAYQKNSLSDLKEILDNWHQYYDHNNYALLTEIEKEVYSIYRAFYQPFTLENIGDSEWGNDIYENIEFLIIQNRLVYDFSYNLSNVFPGDTIYNFRPYIYFDQADILYKSHKYEGAIYDFLGTDFPVKFNEYKLSEYNDVDKRWKFLSNYIKIYYGHWGGYWHINTHPEVDRISLNDRMDKAKVYFRLVYQGGEAELEKINNQWKLIDSQLTWIE